MNRRTPRGVWALRGVTIAIALVVLVIMATVVYSAYEEVNVVRSGQAGGGSLVSGRALYDQATGGETVSFNVTVPNRGLYSLNVTISCRSDNSGISCQRATADIPPGQEQTLHFKMSVANVQQFFASSQRQVNGTVNLALEPFVSLSVGSNFTGFIRLPGGA